jgi:peptidoglycan/LPS O-acetylase OafA/YrhL
MRQVIPSLNGLRALSILFVLFAHVLLMNFHLKDNPGGQIGVSIFFVISGYLITLLLIKEEQGEGQISLKNFYIRRTLRIFPIYYFLLVIYALLELVGLLKFSSNSWITSLTYTKYLSNESKGDWETGHLWSLSVEEHFYLLWPIIFKFFKKLRVSFAFLIITCVTLIRLITDVSVMHLFTRADALLWGCIFAFYNDKLVGFLRKRNAFFHILPFLALLFVIIFKRSFTLSRHNEYGNIGTTFFGSYGLITDLCIGFIILVSINFKNNLWFSFLNSSPLDYLGRLSYSIYLWQQIFFSSRVSGINRFPFNILLIIIVAYLSYNYIEKPFLSLKTKFVSMAAYRDVKTGNGLLSSYDKVNLSKL